MNPIPHNPAYRPRSCRELHAQKPVDLQHLLPTTEAKHQVQRRLLLNVVVGEGSAIFQLLSGEDETLLVRRNALLVLDLALDVVDGVARFNLQCDRLAGESFDEDLHTTTKTEDQVEGRLLLDVVVGESAAVLELLAGENQALLVRWDALLVLNL
jgi:hypothetical protein